MTAHKTLNVPIHITRSPSDSRNRLKWLDRLPLTVESRQSTNVLQQTVLKTLSVFSQSNPDSITCAPEWPNACQTEAGPLFSSLVIFRVHPFRKKTNFGYHAKILRNGIVVGLTIVLRSSFPSFQKFVLHIS